MRLGELAAQEGVAAPSMTRIVASLERAALVRRTQDPADGRAYLVQATADGEGLVLAGRAARMVALRTRLEGLPPDQQAAVLAERSRHSRHFPATTDHRRTGSPAPPRAGSADECLVHQRGVARLDRSRSMRSSRSSNGRNALFIALIVNQRMSSRS